jgi:hypothetical protein
MSKQDVKRRKLRRTMAETLVEKLKLEKDVTDLINAGKNDVEIADQLGLPPDHVSKFRAKKNQEKDALVVKSTKNVFDLKAGLTSVYAELLNALNEAKASGNTEVTVKVISELRQALKLAGDVLEKVYIEQENALFRQAMVDAMNEVAPGIKPKIIERLEELKRLHGAMKK